MRSNYPPPSHKKTRFALIAGEASGDKLGGHLITALKDTYGTSIEIAGVGGSAMIKCGLKSWFDMSDLSHIGLLSVLKNLPMILRRLKETINRLLHFQPDILIIIDSPDFTHRVARALRKHRPETLIINLAPPSVWAWRPSRAKKMSRYIDLCLGIFPFEEPAYQKLEGPPLTYVGHPMLSDLPDEYAQEDAEHDRAIKTDADNIILLMPGSRSSVIARNLTAFSTILTQLKMRLDLPVRLILPTVPSCRDMVQSFIPMLPYPTDIITDNTDYEAAIKKARIGLFSFGTAALEGTLRQLPMINIYRLNKLETIILRRLIRLKNYALPNIIHGEAFMTESTRTSDDPAQLADELLLLWNDGEMRRNMLDKMRAVKMAMQREGLTPEQAAVEAIGALGRTKGLPL